MGQEVSKCGEEKQTGERTPVKFEGDYDALDCEVLAPLQASGARTARELAAAEGKAAVAANSSSVSMPDLTRSLARSLAAGAPPVVWVIAEFDCEGEAADELSFRAGDQIQLKR